MTIAQLRSFIGPFVATVILYLVLVQPNHPAAFGWGALLVFPLEHPAILLSVLALGRTRLAPVLLVGLTAALTIILVLKTADLVSFNVLSRGFNPVADLALVDAFVRLIAGALGRFMATVAVLGSALAVIGAAALIWWALGIWARFAISPVAARSAAAAALVATGICVAEAGEAMGRWDLPVAVPGAAFTARVGVERINLARATLAELRDFRTAATNDPFSESPRLFDAIDRDVLVVFIESYGRTSFDTPFYADMHRATLAGYEARLRDLGVSTRSGFLTSPTQGGQSWLAHSTFANGLWITNQVSYAAALASGRATLYHHAANSGFRTATLMPQITLDWPESAQMGFEDILVARDLDYRGLPFNWVTMPDQFSLAALDRLLRNGTDPRRLFAQVALVSSHAPWVPVPGILPWEDIGDGTIYNEIVISGETPEVVWRDRERVRFQYRLAVDYSLQSVLEYAVLHAADPPLMIVVGDHQAAEFIALDGRHEVPIHIIGPDHLVAALSDSFPDQGLLPADGREAIAMQTMRDVLLNAYIGPLESGLGQTGLGN